MQRQPLDITGAFTPKLHTKKGSRLSPVRLPSALAARGARNVQNVTATPEYYCNRVRRTCAAARVSRRRKKNYRTRQDSRQKKKASLGRTRTRTHEHTARRYISSGHLPHQQKLLRSVAGPACSLKQYQQWRERALCVPRVRQCTAERTIFTRKNNTINIILSDWIY